MAKYSLTERQKNLLRLLVPGLQDGTIKTQWGYGHTMSGSIIVPPLPSEIREQWRDVGHADFDDFCGYGFFRPKTEGSYTLNAQLIIDAVSNNFGENTQSSIPDVANAPNRLIIEPLFGVPVTSSQFKCDIFMVMPFADEFQPIYWDHILPAIQALNLEIKRANDFFSKHDMMFEIWSGIWNSRIVVADCTGKNPNVFYEMGIAHTLGKPVIMMAQDINDIPFDVRGKRAIVYEYTPRGMKQFEEDLRNAILKVLDDVDVKTTDE